MRYVNQAIKIKNLNLKNRLILPPMATSCCDKDGAVTPELLQYYNEKSHGGYLSMIITEHSYVARDGMAGKGQMSISKDSDIEGLKSLTEVIHNNGTKVIAQISHAGGAAKKSITNEDTIAPSKVKLLNGVEADHIITESDIQRLISEFGEAARRAISAGFDGVEIHSAHKYLLNQFYSPLTNKRDDEYGKDIEGRIRFHIQIIEEVRKQIGESYPILLRLGALDYMEGGSQISDAIYASKRLEEAGVDMLDISGGMNGFIVKGKEKEQGYYADVTEKIKQNVDIPIIMTGGIRDINVADQIIREGKADLIGVGRAMLKDSNWAEKAFLNIKEA